MVSIGPDAASGTDVIVIGAGVIGLAIGESLSASGLRVRVIDRRDPLAGGASVANAGWINPPTVEPLPSRAALGYGLRSFTDPGSPLYIRPRISLSLTRWLLRFARSSGERSFARGRAALLELAHGASDRYLAFGDQQPIRVNAEASMSVFADDAGAWRAARELDELDGAPEFEVLDQAEALDAEPLLTEAAHSALVVHGDLQIEPATILRALMGAIRERGSIVDLTTEAIGLLVTRGRVRGVRTVGGELQAGAVVVTAGAWSPRLLAPLGVRLGMEAGKGYSIELPLATPPRLVVSLADAKVGIVPHAGGARLVGTMELSGVNERLDARRIEGILAAARPFLRGLRDAEGTIDVHRDVLVGARPMFADGLPVIDRIESVEGLYLSTGHAMMGVTLAMNSAAHLNEFIRTGTRPPVLEPFRLRARDRALRRNEE